MLISYYPPDRHLGGPTWFLPRVFLTAQWTTVGFMVMAFRHNLQLYFRLPQPIRRWMKAAWNRRAETPGIRTTEDG